MILRGLFNNSCKHIVCSQGPKRQGVRQLKKVMQQGDPSGVVSIDTLQLTLLSYGLGVAEDLDEQLSVEYSRE